MLYLAHNRLRHRTPARNVLQKLGNVFDPLRTAVGDQQHGFFAHCVLAEVAAVALNSCTNCARFFTLSTGVWGRMPWPRLKMCPGRPSASGMRQSRPMTSAPVSDIEGNNVALSVPK